MSGPIRLAVVIPCYNEQEVLGETSRRLLALFARLIADGKISSDSRILFIDDGSRDGTWTLIEQLAAKDDRIAGIKLSRNQGHQNALLAGLLTAQGDAIVSMDADLQDDIEIMETMIDQHLAGAEIVYGVRKSRKTDTGFKRGSAGAFYGIMKFLGAESIPNHADYRLMSRRAVESLKLYPEVNLYLRGLVPLLGFTSAQVYYDRSERVSGSSKYSLSKMMALAADAVTSFSIVPLRLIGLLGVLIFLGSIAVSFWVLWVVIFNSAAAVPGWASTVLPITFLGGVQIFCIGVLGEYLGKQYIEVKARPRFIIEKIVNG